MFYWVSIVFIHLFPNLENNDIYAFGINTSGQLALNAPTGSCLPKKIKFFQNEKIIDITGGYTHTLFIAGKI